MYKIYDLNTITYQIKVFIFLKVDINIINKYYFRFSCHGDIEVRKPHLITYEKTCKLKSFKGFGLSYLIALLFAYCCSLFWRVFHFISLLTNSLKAKHTFIFIKCILIIASSYEKSLSTLLTFLKLTQKLLLEMDETLIIREIHG